MACKHIIGRAAVVTGLGLGLWGCNDGSPTTPPMDAVALEEARAATARYGDVAVALADGFVQASPCESLAGRGAMGFHYLNPARMDGRLAIAEPEVLLYIPDGGRLRLVGIEYVLPIFQDGRPFFGPGAPATPGPPQRCSASPSTGRWRAIIRRCRGTTICTCGCGARTHPDTSPSTTLR